MRNEGRNGEMGEGGAAEGWRLRARVGRRTLWLALMRPLRPERHLAPGKRPSQAGRAMSCAQHPRRSTNGM